MKFGHDIIDANSSLSVGLGIIGGVLAGVKMPHPPLMLGLDIDTIIFICKVSITGTIGGIAGAAGKDFYAWGKHRYTLIKLKRKRK